jgi:RING-box protein 1
MQDQLDFVKKFELIKLNSVCLWRWDSRFDSCGICKNNITDKCIECIADLHTDNTCSIVWGICGHMYHVHCITHWLKSRNVCPLCNDNWTVHKVE